jgi:hypothetical protein
VSLKQANVQHRPFDSARCAQDDTGTLATAASLRVTADGTSRAIKLPYKGVDYRAALRKGGRLPFGCRAPSKAVGIRPASRALGIAAALHADRVSPKWVKRNGQPSATESLVL